MSQEEIVKEHIRSYFRQNLKRVLPPNYEEIYVKRAFDHETWQGILNRLESNYKRLSKNSRILDLGCGFGSFLVDCPKKYYSIGIDSDISALKIARLREMEVIRAVGEKLPFRKDCFNAIIMHSVIEHVASPQDVIHEAWTVLKSKGALLIDAPNYMSFKEGHYRLFWLPKFPKRFAKIYLRLRKRDPSYLESINYITINQLLNMLNSFNLLLNYRFQEFLNSPEKIPSKVHRIAVIFLKKFKLLPLLEKIIVKIKPLSLYYKLGIIPLSPYVSIIVAKA